MTTGLYFVTKPCTLPFVADTLGSQARLVDAPAVPRRPKPRRRTMRFLVVLVASLLVGNALIGERGLITMVRANRDLFALSQMIAALRAENESLRDEARRLLVEPRAIEELARQELGLIRPGERLFIVTPAPASESSLPVVP